MPETVDGSSFPDGRPRLKETFLSGRAIPERYCENCGRTMYPKLMESGTWEWPALFDRRDHCSKSCGVGRLQFSERDLKNMEALYSEQGLSTLEIADLYNCLGGSVHRRLVQRGVAMRGPAERHPRRDRSYETPRGYVKVGDRYEHRVVAEEKLGRPLRDGEVVHHVNGDKQDNRPENLRVFESASSHMTTHREELTTWSREADAILCRLREADVSISRTAELLGVSFHSVAHRYQRLVARGRCDRGSPGRKPGGPPPIPEEVRWIVDALKATNNVRIGE